LSVRSDDFTVIEIDFNCRLMRAVHNRKEGKTIVLDLQFELMFSLYGYAGNWKYHLGLA
jgi:hypothetical protein